MSRDIVVILDSLNYIKGIFERRFYSDAIKQFQYQRNLVLCPGYRYELYCSAKAHKTPHCVVSLVFH